MTQCTLLQLNFCSRTNDKLDSRKLKHLEDNVALNGPDNNLAQSDPPKFSHLDAYGENDNKKCRLDIDLDSVICNYIDSSAENFVDDHKISHDASSCPPSLLPRDNMPIDVITVVAENIAGVTLDTFIVGRKFSDEEKLNIGASISLLRDLDNAKDPNAIKVWLFLTFVYFEYYFSLHSLIKGLHDPSESGSFYNFRMH